MFYLLTYLLSVGLSVKIVQVAGLHTYLCCVG